MFAERIRFDNEHRRVLGKRVREVSYIFHYRAASNFYSTVWYSGIVDSQTEVPSSNIFAALSRGNFDTWNNNRVENYTPVSCANIQTTQVSNCAYTIHETGGRSRIVFWTD